MGLTLEETAEAMGNSEGTAKRDWAYAHAWLFNEIKGMKPGAEADNSEAKLLVAATGDRLLRADAEGRVLSKAFTERTCRYPGCGVRALAAGG